MIAIMRRAFIDKVTEDDKYLIVNSFSKSWAMTGWRLGWLTAPKSLIKDAGDRERVQLLLHFRAGSNRRHHRIAGW